MEDTDHDPGVQTGPPDQPGCLQKTSRLMRTFWGIITIEPAIFIQTLSWGLQSVISQNLLIEKCCRDLKFSEDICADIAKNPEDHPKVNSEVEKHAATYQMYMNILAAIPGIFIALFVGPWSDKNGRKPVIMLPLVGYLVSQLVYILNVYYREAPATYLLFTASYGFFGGFATLLVGMYSFLADKTSIRARTSRIALLDVFLFAGLPCGTFASAYVYKYCGYYGVFCLVAACQLLSLTYVSFLRDTRGPNSSFSYPGSELDTRASLPRRLLSIVDVAHVKDVFKTTFKRRDYNLRKVIFLLMLLMLVNVTVFSDGGILYLYTRKKFDWNEQQYTKFQTMVIVVSATASFILMPLLSYKLQVHDAMIGILASLSKFASLIVTALANSGYVLFFAGCLGVVSGLSSIVIRSILSKCASHSELGKIFSLLASLEAAVPLFSTALCTTIYNATIDTFPGAVFLVQASFFMVSCAVFIYVFYLLTRTGQDFALLVEAEEDENFIQTVNREENTA